jgi:Polyketide cyclase / dehydrase and lipid transport
MKSYEVTETIQAGPDEVWAVLGDVEHHPDWDSGVEKVEGRLEQGAKLKVFSELDPGRGYPVKVTELSPGKGMAWRGGMPLGLFKACARTASRRPATARRGSSCASSSAGRCCR